MEDGAAEKWGNPGPGGGAHSVTKAAAALPAIGAEMALRLEPSGENQRVYIKGSRWIAVTGCSHLALCQHV